MPSDRFPLGVAMHRWFRVSTTRPGSRRTGTVVAHDAVGVEQPAESVRGLDQAFLERRLRSVVAKDVRAVVAGCRYAR